MHSTCACGRVFGVKGVFITANACVITEMKTCMTQKLVKALYSNAKES